MESQQPTGTVDSLPHHLLIEILSRLSLKSLVSCRFVSKLFRSILNDPYFNQILFPSSLLIIPTEKKNLHFFNLQEVKPLLPGSRLDLPIKTHFPSGDLKIVNSCNGLLCLRERENWESTIYVCNPILGEFITLPKPKPGVWVYKVAIGFSSNTSKEYKVVRIVCKKFVVEAEVYVIGGGTKLWRSVGKPPSRFLESHNFDVFVNGAVHWVAYETQLPRIWAFDFDTEVFRRVPEPYMLDELGNLLSKKDDVEMQVGVLNDRLSVHVSLREMSGCYRLDSWVMMDYGLKDSWTKLYSIPFSKKPFNLYTPLTSLSSGALLMVSSAEHSLKSYDPEKKMFSSHVIGVKIGSAGCVVAVSLSFVSLRVIVNGEVKVFSL